MKRARQERNLNDSSKIGLNNLSQKVSLIAKQVVELPLLQVSVFKGVARSQG